MVTKVDTTLVLVGANDPTGLITLNENAAATDKNWISIPYNAVYTVAKDISDELGTLGDPLIKLTNLLDTQLFQSWTFTTVPFPRYTGTNFSIVPGRGYEYVTKNDTTWNPTEYTNRTAAAMLARRQLNPADPEMHNGTLTEADRTPVWSVEVGTGATPHLGSKEIDYLDAQVYASVEKGVEPDLGYREAGISHVIHADFRMKDVDHIAFTAYRSDRPYDVLTENVVGSGYSSKDDCHLIWFDVGNFMKPWKDGEEVVLIIEAAKDGRGYFTVLDFTLDKTLDVQHVVSNVALTAIPDPETMQGSVTWIALDNENIVGYSLYRNDERLNESVISGVGYSAHGDVALKPVIKGGHETVYGSQGAPTALTPVSYAFTIAPNPFVKQTSVNYALPRASEVAIKVYDVAGKLVKTLVSERLDAGYYTASWAGRDNIGRNVAAGVYFIEMNAKGFESQHKVVFVR